MAQVAQSSVMSKIKHLPPKLEAVLIRLGKRAKLNVTQAVKLPYLVDVVATHVLDRPITEGTHETWEKGVVTREVWHFLTKTEDSPVFHLEPVRWSEERKVVIDVDDTDSVLAPEEQHIVDFVAQELASISASELGRMTKLMNPQISSWGSNKRANTRDDAFDRLSQDYQEMAERAASMSLDQLRREAISIDDIEDAVA